MTRPEVLISPQPGPQTDFLSSKANIAIFGGSAGGGKTHALLLEPLRHFENEFPISCVTFRRTMTEVKKPGGLWDKSMELYFKIGGTPLQHMAQWTFGNKLKISFAHLEYDSTVYDWQGAEIPIIQFDELAHFSEHQFWYLFSRNRSTSGVQGYIRATCNPVSDHWLRKFIDWWIDEEGFPIKERSGKLRWFFRNGDNLEWADTKEELLAMNPEAMPKSVTFIASTVYDNKILLDKDPEYLANLKSLPRVERERLLHGNWNVRAQAGDYFKRSWFPIVEAMPLNVVRSVRYWDRASTKPNQTNKDPDWSRGVKMEKLSDGTHIVSSVVSDRNTPMEIERLIRNTAQMDGVDTAVILEQEPGASGQAEIDYLIRSLSGFEVRSRKVTKDKVTRAKPVSSQSQAGNIKLLRGLWNDDFLSELENFSDDGVGHDDQVDAFGGAFNEMNEAITIFDVM